MNGRQLFNELNILSSSLPNDEWNEFKIVVINDNKPNYIYMATKIVRNMGVRRIIHSRKMLDDGEWIYTDRLHIQVFTEPNNIFHISA